MGWRRGRSPVAAAWKARIAGASTGSTSTSTRSWSEAVRRGGRQPRATRDGRVLLVDEGPGIQPIEGVAGPPACDRARDLRPRLRPRRRAAAGSRDRRPAVAHPGGSDRAGHRRARTTDPVSRQRPPRGDVGQRGGGVCRALRGAPRPQFRARHDERLGVRVRGGAPGGGGRAGQGHRPAPGRACRRQRGGAAAGVGRLEPEPRALVTGRRPPPVRRPDRRLRPGWRAAKRRGRRNGDRRRAAGQHRAHVGWLRRRGHHVRRPRTGCDRGRHPSCAGRRA